MLYSVRMRAAKGGAHENGGKHISGAERLLEEEFIDDTICAMVKRAQSHGRGKADFVNIKIEAIPRSAVEKLEVLSIESLTADSVQKSQIVATQLLQENKVDLLAIKSAFELLLNLKESMRGAILIDAVTGKRVDSYGARGVRVSKMDVENEADFMSFLRRGGSCGAHLREAVVLATKVAAAPGIVGELCWSDDPEYTTGYVSIGGKYYRIAPLKEFGDERGGRVFFVKPGADLEKMVHYLEKQPVLVSVNRMTLAE